MPINIAIQTGNVELVKLFLHNPFSNKTLSINPYVGNSFGKGPLICLEEKKSEKESTLSETAYREIKQELENATKEMDKIYNVMQKSVKEELERLNTTIKYFEEKIVLSDSKSKEQFELNELSSKRLRDLREVVNKTILLPKQKAEILKPLEAMLQKLGLRRSNSVSSYFSPKVELVKPSGTPPTPAADFGRRLRSLTSKANLGGSQTKRT